MAGTTLPGAGDERDEEARVVCHVDMDCFYASCERLKEPALEGEPVVVGMGYEPGETIGAVATASYEAREYGVDSAQPISQALERLPRVVDARDDPDVDVAEAGHYRPVDMDFYESVAADVKAVLHDCADVVREVSIDEAYLDATDRTAWDVVDGRPLAEGYGRHVKQRIQAAVGVPASVGVAPNMSTAKIASDHDKPDGLVVVPPDEVRAFLAPLPVEAIHGVGPVTARELAAEGIETAGDLAEADPAMLRREFGKRGPQLGRRARGRDDRPVEPRGRPKSLNRESAFAEATDDDERKREKVRALAADVADRARSREALYRTIGVKVVEPPFDVNTRERSLSGPVDDPDLVESVALDLLAEFEGCETRKLGVRVSNLSFSGGDQARLGGGAWDSSDEGEKDAGAADGERVDTEAGSRPVTLADFTTAEDVDAGTDSGAGEAAPDGQTSLGEFDRPADGGKRD
jgi:DNA polymerase IV (DinB-like DNA polymerase)